MEEARWKAQMSHEHSLVRNGKSRAISNIRGSAFVFYDLIIKNLYEFKTIFFNTFV